MSWGREDVILIPSILCCEIIINLSVGVYIYYFGLVNVSELYISVLNHTHSIDHTILNFSHAAYRKTDKRTDLNRGVTQVNIYIWTTH